MNVTLHLKNRSHYLLCNIWVDPINPVLNSSQVYHICFKFCKSASGLKIQLVINQDV